MHVSREIPARIADSLPICSEQWDNRCMHKKFTPAVNILAAGMMLIGSTHSQGQQTPVAKTHAAPATPARHTAATKSPAVPALTTPKDKFSYALGMNLGT